MSKHITLRGMALMLCLALLAASGLAEAGDAFIAPAEEPVPEAPEFILTPEEALPEAQAWDAAPDPMEDGLPRQVAAPEGVDAGAQQATPEAAQVMPETDQPDASPAAETPAANANEFAFTGTQVVESDTWQGLNLVRASGFTGPLAQVNGQLVLSAVTLDGVPARQADLSAYFTLGPTGSIVILDDSALTLNVCAFSFNKGSKATLTLYAGGTAVPPKQAKWASSNKSVARVSSRGEVKAKKAGVAIITATVSDVTTRCAVVVTDFKQVKSVKLSSKKLNLALYGSVQLGAAIKPADAYDPTLTWASSAPEIVSVDANGWIAGLSGGKATVTATAANGKSAKCVVTVQEIKPSALAFAQPYVSLNPGAQLAAQVRFNPETVSNPSVTFASSDPAVATVNASGLITAVGIGTATVTATSIANPAAQASCRVSVREPGSARMAGLKIGINPGHQIKTIKTKYPLAPGSSKKAYGVKTGACGKWTRVNEYETVLQIGLKLAQLLSDAGATVVITRTSNDVMLTNIDRARMLNEAGVDVALQLHCNSSSSARHEGCSGYIRTTGDWVNESRAIAAALTDAISASTGCVNLGVKVFNEYMSLNWTTTPSVLLEMGYLSNRKEDALLATDDYRQRMAEGIYEGLCAYFGR